MATSRSFSCENKLFPVFCDTPKNPNYWELLGQLLGNFANCWEKCVFFAFSQQLVNFPVIGVFSSDWANYWELLAIAGNYWHLLAFAGKTSVRPGKSDQKIEKFGNATIFKSVSSPAGGFVLGVKNAARELKRIDFAIFRFLARITGNCWANCWELLGKRTFSHVFPAIGVFPSELNCWEFLAEQTRAPITGNYWQRCRKSLGFPSNSTVADDARQ